MSTRPAVVEGSLQGDARDQGCHMVGHSARTVALVHGRVTQCGWEGRGFSGPLRRGWETSSEMSQGDLLIGDRGADKHGETEDPKSTQICRFSTSKQHV